MHIRKCKVKCTQFGLRCYMWISSSSYVKCRVSSVWPPDGHALAALPDIRGISTEQSAIVCPSYHVQLALRWPRSPVPRAPAARCWAPLLGSRSRRLKDNGFLETGVCQPDICWSCWWRMLQADRRRWPLGGVHLLLQNNWWWTRRNWVRKQRGIISANEPSTHRREKKLNN